MPDYAIGIDLGGTKILAGLVNRTNGEVLFSVKHKTRSENGCDYVIGKIKQSITEVIEESRLDTSQISCIGIGAPGQVNRTKGILLSAPNLDCNNVNLKAILEREFYIPAFIGNDVEIAAIGEYKFGAGRDCQNMVCVFVGTGIGSGINRDGRVYYGNSGTAGEIGHIIVDAGGRPCGCGGNGCLEAYASRSAIEKRITGALKKGRTSIITEFMKDSGQISSKMIRKALEHNDELVMQVLLEASDYLSNGLATIINFYNPEAIIMGGGLIDAIDEFYQRSVKKAKLKALPTPAQTTIFKKAELGDFSGVIGACFLEEQNKFLKPKLSFMKEPR